MGIQSVRKFGIVTLLASSMFAVIAGCNGGGGETDPSRQTTFTDDGKGSGGKVSGSINIDGSSTVYPITSGAADMFKETQKDVKINVGQAGTGAGMKKFVAGEIDICDASRPISKEEMDEATKNGMEVVEIPIAFDGLTVVVNKKNEFAKTMTTEELRKLWDEKSTIKAWNEINPAWPAKPIKLYGPTSAHGSFEYFTEAIVKTKKKCRTDYQQCTDYAQVSAGVGQDESALGYLGLGYYTQAQDTLNAVSIDSGKGPIIPSKETIVNGTYTPLSRVLAVYTTKKALERPEVVAFLKYLIGAESQKMIETEEVGFVDLPAAVYKSAETIIDTKKTGSVLMNAPIGGKVEELFK